MTEEEQKMHVLKQMLLMVNMTFKFYGDRIY